jgi:group I intron endonuclease
MAKICGIYKIECLITNNIYIGQTRNFIKRKTSYKNSKNKSQQKITNSIEKYGWINHRMELIHECSIEELNKFECHYISFYDTFNTSHGLNLRIGGDVNFKVSDETRNKQSNKMKGRYIGDKNPFFGKKHTEETNKKNSEYQKGIPAWNKGKKGLYVPSENTKLKIKDTVTKTWSNTELKEQQRNRTKNLWKDPEYVKKHAEATAKSWTEERRNSRAEKIKGDKNPFFNRTHTEATKEKIRLAKIGKKQSEETKMKKAEKCALYWTEERRKAISERMKGEGNTFFGKKHKTESIEKAKNTKLNKQLILK